MTKQSKYWFLREGDFFPEMTDEVREHISLKLLKEAGNLFETREDAIEASMAVRSELARLKCLRKERQVYIRQSEILQGIDQSNGQKCQLRQVQIKEILDHLDALRLHIEQISSHQED